MTDDRLVVDLIERAHDAHQMCTCGRHTTTSWHDDRVWVECPVLTEPRHGLRGALSGLTALTHTRISVVDVPAQRTESTPR